MAVVTCISPTVSMEGTVAEGGKLGQLDRPGTRGAAWCTNAAVSLAI